MGGPVLSGRPARPPSDVEDVRSARPYYLAPTPLKTIARRIGSAVALVTIDIGGLVLGLYAALALLCLVWLGFARTSPARCARRAAGWVAG